MRNEEKVWDGYRRRGGLRRIGLRYRPAFRAGERDRLRLPDREFRIRDLSAAPLYDALPRGLRT